MSDRSRRRYESQKQAIEVRTAACGLAVETMGDADDPARLMAFCVFFESFIGRGSRWTQKHMKLMPNEKTPVLQLITRD